MKFFDAHTHTPDLSPCCSKLVKIGHYIDAIKRNKDLKGVCITNHAFSTYFPKEIYKGWTFMERPELFDQYEHYGNQRIMDFLTKIAPHFSDGLVMGLEVELMNNGKINLSKQMRDFIPVVIGSLHWISPDKIPERKVHIWDMIFEYYETLFKNNVSVVAHPFRWGAKFQGLIPTPEIIEVLVKLQKEYGVAGEINGHIRYNFDKIYLEKMVENGVEVAFSTDAHSIKEIGKFDYHKSLLEESGLTIDDLKVWEPTDFPDLCDIERERVLNYSDNNGWRPL